MAKIRTKPPFGKKRNPQDANVRQVARARQNTEARLLRKIKNLEHDMHMLTLTCSTLMAKTFSIAMVQDDLVTIVGGSDVELRKDLTPDVAFVRDRIRSLYEARRPQRKKTR